MNYTINELNRCANSQADIQEQPRPVWLTRLRNATTWLMVQVCLSMTIMVPHNAMAGTTVYSRPAPVVSPLDANGVDMSWAHWAAQSQNWTSRYDPDGNLSISVPKDNFALVGRSVWHAPTPGTPGSLDFDVLNGGGMTRGDKWVTLGRETVGQAGVTNAQMSDQIARFPKNTDYVFAQYSPENATAHITIQRIEKMPDGTIEVRVADFTPFHGDYWAANGDYRTPMEIAAKVPGHNPFANFEGAKTDALFHNITWEATKVAVGHAMRKYGASLAYVAVAETRFTQNTSTKGGLFRKKITTVVTGYVKPRWYVAEPMELQPSGETAQICAVPTGANAGCDDPAHIAIAGVMFAEWKGGNMPANEDMMYQWTQTTSSFTVFFFAIILAIVTFGAALVLLPAGGLMVAGMGLTATNLAIGAGAAYMIGSTVFSHGGSVLQAQSSMFSNTSDGWMQPVVSGSAQQAGLTQAIQDDMVTPQMGAGVGGLTGTDTLYKGNCPPGFTVGQCQSVSLDPGTAWRPDSYIEYNLVLATRQRMAYCTALPTDTPAGLGLTGVAAEKCAAPATMQY